MTLNLPKVIPEFLQKYSNEKFTSHELAKGIFKDYHKQCEEKRQRSKATKVLLIDYKALIRQISAEIAKLRPSLQKKYSQIKTIETRPRKYYYTEKTDIEEIEQIETFNASYSSLKTKEKDLYSKLSEFLHSEFNFFYIGFFCIVIFTYI